MKWSLSNLRYYPHISLDKLRKCMKTYLSQDGHSLGQDEQDSNLLDCKSYLRENFFMICNCFLNQLFKNSANIEPI
jgi:hypothetical protein